MTQISRREVLVGLTATAALTVMPAAPVFAAPAPFVEVLPSWIVGTPGEFDWMHVTARTVEDALHNYTCEQIGGNGCEEGGESDCDCEWCCTIGGLEVERKAVWDGKQKVTAADWIRIGWGHTCSRCREETCRDNGHAVGDEAVCDACMTLADWEIVDPVRAARMRAESA